MCQAFKAEQGHHIWITLRYGSYASFIKGKKVLKDYCYTHDNYWCGCSDMVEKQKDPKIRAKRAKRQKDVLWAKK